MSDLTLGLAEAKPGPAGFSGAHALQLLKPLTADPVVVSGTFKDGKQKWIAQLPETIVLAEQLESIERDLLEKALTAANGVQAEAARRLGISRSDIAYKIKKYGL